MGGSLFASRSIYNGFAVVSTDGIANVPVKLENNLVGTTDKRGMLLIAPLNAYQNNKVSIDPMDLPADVHIDRVDMEATPTDRAGTLVRFGITPIRAASITLVDAAGKSLPLGSRASVRGHASEPALVGFDGAVYLDTLDLRNVLDVDTPTGTCHVSFDYHKQGDSIPQIGPLTCQVEGQR
jgi:outer membrane usher protein